MNNARLLNLVLCLGLFMSCAGCSHVHPYEREYLTRPGMDLQREAFKERFEAHVQNSREGAVGSVMTESTGGGCGCN